MNAAASLRRLLGALVLAALVVPAVACGGDDDSTGPEALDRDLVVGFYDLDTLTFDVAGGAFGEYDLLEPLAIDPSTFYLNVVGDGTVDLLFLNPTTGGSELVGGTYTLQQTGIRIEFENASQPGLLLLPRVLELTYDDESGSLSFLSDVSVPLQRLILLAPELDGEPLSDPVPGVLHVVFAPRT